MASSPDALWLNVSPALEELDMPCLNVLSRHGAIARYQYYLSQDEPMCFHEALTLLHDYLKQHDRPLHLVGHGMSGLLGWLYSRRHPERVRSLTLLSVGIHPAVDWQAHYHVQRQLLPCSREQLLVQTVYSLFGYQCPPVTKKLARMLARDLNLSLSPHTLYRRVNFFPDGVPVPVMIARGENDVIIDPNSWQGWWLWLKDGDRLWQCPNGRYFFHYFQPKIVADEIVNFWNRSFDPSDSHRREGLLDLKS